MTDVLTFGPGWAVAGVELNCDGVTRPQGVERGVLWTAGPCATGWTVGAPLADAREHQRLAASMLLLAAGGG